MQVIERILLSPKKTGLHDDVLQILFLHMDPILPLPRIRMLSVTNLTLAAHCTACSPVIFLVLMLHMLYCRFCTMFLVLFLLTKGLLAQH